VAGELSSHKEDASNVSPDLWCLNDKMLRSRLFEIAVAGLWKAGMISGEMHLGTGEEAVCDAVRRSDRLLAVDEDYRRYGLSGELAAISLEAGLKPGMARVRTEQAIPFARSIEERVLPNVGRDMTAALDLIWA
jgi:hypothetical protein